MKFLITIMLCALGFVANAQLASQSYWTTNIPTRYLPVGAVIPENSEVDSMLNLAAQGDLYVLDFTMNLPGTLDNVDEAAAFDAVGDALYTEILSTYAVGEWGMDTSANLWGKAVITDIRRRHSTFEPTNLPMQYTVAGDVFRCAGKFYYTKF